MSITPDDWYRHPAAKNVSDLVDEALATGYEPDREAQGPPFAAAVAVWAFAGLVAGGIAGGAVAWALVHDRGLPLSRVLNAVCGFGGLTGFLGAVLGATLYAFDEILWVLPGIVGLAVGGLLGAAAGWLTVLWPAVPFAHAPLIGAGVGVVFAALFQVFESRLP